MIPLASLSLELSADIRLDTVNEVLISYGDCCEDDTGGGKDAGRLPSNLPTPQPMI